MRSWTGSAVGTPLFESAVIHLENGKTLEINAEGNDAHTPYVSGFRVDGRKAQSWFLSHEEIADGAVIDFYMSEEPSDR